MSAVVQIPAYIKADLVKAVGKKLKVCLGGDLGQIFFQLIVDLRRALAEGRVDRDDKIYSLISAQLGNLSERLKVLCISCAYLPANRNIIKLPKTLTNY